MSDWKITGSLLAGLVLAACGANEVMVQGQFPAPVLEKIPVTLGVYYDEEFRNHEFFDQSAKPGESDWTVYTGAAQTTMYDSLLNGMFERVVLVEELPWQPPTADATPAAQDSGAASTTTGRTGAGLEVDAILVPHVDELQYAIPRHTRINVFEVWMRYRYQLYRVDGEFLADWTMTCYGKTPTAFLQGAEEAVNLAAVQALRDAGANFAMNFARVPEIDQWLEEIGVGENF